MKSVSEKDLQKQKQRQDEFNKNPRFYSQADFPEASSFVSKLTTTVEKNKLDLKKDAEPLMDFLSTASVLTRTSRKKKAASQNMAIPYSAQVKQTFQIA